MTSRHLVLAGTAVTYALFGLAALACGQHERTLEPGSASGEGGVGGRGTLGSTSNQGNAGSAPEGDRPSTARTLEPTGTLVSCEFNIEPSLSEAIATVGIVTWSTTLPALDSARIEFGLADTGATMVAPVALTGPGYRTLLLGMKGDRDYVLRVIANSGANSCISPEYVLRTGLVPNDIPAVERELFLDGAQSQGFIVTSFGLGSLAFDEEPIATPAIILDSDGDVVWWADAPRSTSRARMSWDGQRMLMMSLNVGNDSGEFRSVAMDGLDVDADVSGLSNGHHDFTVLPDGTVTAITWTEDCTAIVERAPGGTLTAVVPDIRELYEPGALNCHTNAILYYPSDDTYTLSDRSANLFVKVSRRGELIWQFGGRDPRGHHFPGEWHVNHGHQLLENGNFLFFNNGSGNEASSVLEYRLNETDWSAALLWSYVSDASSASLGDAQRLPNGNTLVTYSNQGVIREVDGLGRVVQSLTTASLGYADFRESLYGSPLR